MWLFAAPAEVGGDDHGVTHAGSTQAAAQLIEESVEQRLQGEEEQNQTHEDPTGLLEEKLPSNHLRLLKVLLTGSRILTCQLRRARAAVEIRLRVTRRTEIRQKCLIPLEAMIFSRLESSGL